MEQKSQARCTKSERMLIINTRFHVINTQPLHLKIKLLNKLAFMFPSIAISDTLIYNQNSNSNPSYFQEQFFQFPSPFLDHHILNDDAKALAVDQSQPSMPNPDPPLEKTRKDRHRKICTAQGVRGRRMRLPFQVARKFFDLQDMLGFDRAGKTIEWLMDKSQGAIEEITRNIACSTSEKGDIWSNSLDGEKKKRQLRENARARARERTRGKMTKKIASSSSNPNSSFDSSNSRQSLNKQFSNVGISADCPNPIFNNESILCGSDIYNNRNSFLDFLENDPYKWLN